MVWWTRREALEQQYKLREHDLCQTLEAVVGLTRDVLQEHRIRGVVGSRVKRFDALFRKLLDRSATEEIEAPFEYLTDLLGLRVVTPFLEDRGRIEALMRTRFEVVEVDVKGSSRAPGEFGYESTHLLVKIPPAIREAFPEARVDVGRGAAPHDASGRLGRGRARARLQGGHRPSRPLHPAQAHGPERDPVAG